MVVSIWVFWRNLKKCGLVVYCLSLFWRVGRSEMFGVSEPFHSNNRLRL